MMFVLRHIETDEYVCLRQDELEYLAAFSEVDAAREFRDQLQLTEFVDVVGTRLNQVPFDYFYLDGEMLPLADLQRRTLRA